MTSINDDLVGYAPADLQTKGYAIGWPQILKRGRRTCLERIVFDLDQGARHCASSTGLSSPDWAVIPYRRQLRWAHLPSCTAESTACKAGVLASPGPRSSASVRRKLCQRLLFSNSGITRDTCGYQIGPHIDTHWKGITVLLFLPPDRSIEHVGTVIHEAHRDRQLKRAGQVPFAPNSGFAFTVGDNSWHSVDQVGSEIDTRDLIILQYFIDSGLFANLAQSRQAPWQFHAK